MSVVEVQFNGLRALEADEQVSMDYALDASDCYVDDNAVRGRNGYKATTAAGVGSGTLQAFARFRPSATVARSVLARGGRLWLVSDPSSESASDGSATDLGSLFGASANVSLAQLGKYLYCAPADGGAWKRVKPDLSVESITPLPTIDSTAITATTTAPSITAYSAHTITPSLSGGVANFMGSGWYVLQNATAGGNIVVTLSAAQDMSSHAWLCLFITPETRGQAGLNPVQIEVGDNSGNYYTLGTTVTSSREYGPSAIYLSMLAVPSGIRSAVKKIRFTCVNPDQQTNIAIYGHLPIPAKPGDSSVTYNLTYYNSVLLQESPLSNDIIKTVSPFTLPTYPYVYSYYNSYGYVSSTLTPQVGAQTVYNYRAESSIAGPGVDDLVPVMSFNGMSHVAVGTSDGQADKIRLYKITANGRQLAKEIANPGDGVTFSMNDDQGDLVLANYLYQASGSPPSCEALAAVGGRLVAGGDSTYPQRLYISSYLPFGQTYDPFPQFPNVNVTDADGWSKDIAPSSAEQILWLGDGDSSLYMITNQCCYVMPSLTPNSRHYKIFDRGVLGRRGAIWAEGALYWCSWDGVYSSQNRVFGGELTTPIRRLYTSWLAPDSTVIMGYQNRNLYIVCGTKFLRYNFATQRWTRGTLTDSMFAAAVWSNPQTAIQNFCMVSAGAKIMRWQPSATTDNGTAIPNWSYSTGFMVEGLNTKSKNIFLDKDGSITASLYKRGDTSQGLTLTIATTNESDTRLPPVPKGRKWRLVMGGANTTSVLRCQLEFEAISAKGGS